MEKGLSASQIKHIRSLQQKKFRAETSLFVVEGEKLVEEALHSGFETEGVWYRDEIGEKAMRLKSDEFAIRSLCEVAE